MPEETGIATAWRRLGGHLLDGFLSGLTFWVGWLATSQAFGVDGRRFSQAS